MVQLGTSVTETMEVRNVAAPVPNFSNGTVALSANSIQFFK